MSVYSLPQPAQGERDGGGSSKDSSHFYYGGKVRLDDVHEFCTFLLPVLITTYCSNFNRS